MRDPIGHLERMSGERASDILEYLSECLKDVRFNIFNSNPNTARRRQEAYLDIVNAYDLFGEESDEALRMLCESAANEAVLQGDYETEKDSDSDGVLIEFSKERLEEYWDYVHPANGDCLAAVFTDKMSKSNIDALRQATLEAVRQGAAEGLTSVQIQALLKAKWQAYSTDPDNFRFVDKSGRVWNNDTYINMLARTTAQRVYNDAYLDRMAASGYKYVRLTSLGVPDCDNCKEWQGRLLSIYDGVNRDVPSVADARSAGVFHPNCVCTFARVRNRDAMRELNSK